MGRFIDIVVDGELTGAEAATLVRSCPVDIYALTDERTLAVREERVDECILCGRCVTVAPDQVTVRRAYGAQRPVVSMTEATDG